ncbi:MAG: 16S rRNA (uracil(1498)-N(3))-methyltransferase [Eubacterium sp.]|nr:16S rRNA (uracil(1498)-N(3))-methyltransferase [Eubacterium sp.]
MYRFFAAEENLGDGKIWIQGDDVNHIKNVLRMNPGDHLMVSFGKGVDYECQILTLGQDQIDLEILREEPAVTELPVRLVLFQALPKKDKMELIIQKAVELGASEIVPVASKRCVVKLDDKKAAKKLTRWQGIAESAAKQSGRGFIPEIHEVLTFDQALSYANNLQSLLIPYELSDNMAESVQAMKEACQGDSVGIFIGPEGGFERGEVDRAMEAGAKPISLGKRILRTETAGMTTLSVLMFMIEGKE